MTVIESEQVLVLNTNEKLFTFLSNFENFGKLMPSQIANWQATETTCSFTIQGMADINMEIAEKLPLSKIVYKSSGKAPFSFSMNCLFEEASTSETKFKIALHADLNPFLKMLAERPLSNFVNMLANKLKEVGPEI